MAKHYIEKSLKENEEIIDIALINPIIRFVYIISFFLVLFLLFNLDFWEHAQLWFLFLTVDICLFLDSFKVCILLDTTELCFTNIRVIGKTGWLNTKSLDAPINKINDVSITQGLLGKIFNYSTIVISTSSSKYFYKYIKEADDFKDDLTNYINKYEEKKNNYNSKQEDDKYDKLSKLKKLLDDNIITREEFDKEKEKILK